MDAESNQWGCPEMSSEKLLLKFSSNIYRDAYEKESLQMIANRSISLVVMHIMTVSISIVVKHLV